MFGYVRICRQELDEQEFKRFRAYYCGLCKEIGRYSHFARLGLSYDMTFLLILLSAVGEGDEEFKEHRCLFHPFKKEQILAHNDVLAYVAKMSIILGCRKFEDDWKDERSLKGLFSKLMLKRATKKISRTYLETDRQISFYLSEISRLENENCNDCDEIADCFAKICEVLFVPPHITEENTRRILAWLGYNIGRWIYLIDAFDDLAEDYKKHTYNPYLPRIKNIGTDNRELAAELDITLTYTLANIAAAYDLLMIKRNDTILKNILYAGLAMVQANILNLQEEKDGSIQGSRCKSR